MAKKCENIYKRKDGRWEARYIRGYGSDGRAQLGYCYAATYKEVKDKRNQIILDSGRFVPVSKRSGNILFGDLCDEWLAYIRGNVRESSFGVYRTAVEKHIRPSFGKMPVNGIGYAEINRFSQALLSEKKLSPQRCRNVLAILKMIFRYTAEIHPDIRQQKITYPREERRFPRVLSPGEQETLLSSLESAPEYLGFSVKLALLTGLRVGEICALRWKNVSFSDMTLHVSQTLERIRDVEQGGTKVIISVPKSMTSDRIIPLVGETITLLKSHYVSDPEAFVVTNDPSRFVEPRVLQYELKKLTDQCNLKGVHFHTLRHSFATRCAECGVEIKSLSEILGHSTPRITLEKYVHSSMELKRNELKKLDILHYSTPSESPL